MIDSVGFSYTIGSIIVSITNLLILFAVIGVIIHRVFKRMKTD